MMLLLQSKTYLAVILPATAAQGFTWKDLSAWSKTDKSGPKSTWKCFLSMLFKSVLGGMEVLKQNNLIFFSK